MIRGIQEYKELLSCIELDVDFCLRTNLLQKFTHIDIELTKQGRGTKVTYHNKNIKLMEYEIMNINTQSLKVLKYAINRFNSLRLYEGDKND